MRSSLLSPLRRASSACLALALVWIPLRALAVCDTAGLAEGTVVVELTLTNGTVCLELLSDDAPIHVENFLYYVENGEYDGSLFHRHLADFVLQGGELRRDGMGGYETIPVRPGDPEITNEPCTRDTPTADPEVDICSVRGNERGTVALAKLGGQPNSGTTNWFVNLADNRPNLDNQNEGFTVFARVIGNGMDYIDGLLPTSSIIKRNISGTLASFSSALMAEPSYGDYAGCLNPLGDFSLAVQPTGSAKPLGVLTDPRAGRNGYFFLPLGCGGTLVPDPASFVANACAGAYTSADQLSVEVTDPFAPALVSDPPLYFRFTCAEVDVALPELDVFEATLAGMTAPTFQEAYEDQVVFIESATKIIVPEPSAGLSAAAAGLVLAALARRRRRPRS